MGENYFFSTADFSAKQTNRRLQNLFNFVNMAEKMEVYPYASNMHILVNRNNE